MHNELQEYGDNCECCDAPRKDCSCAPDCKCGCSGMTEGHRFNFDKFMDRIVISESKQRPTADSPLRKRAQRHQERPLNRIKFGGGQ
jgi:hypothetical protein